jgi:hypothetical protein
MKVIIAGSRHLNPFKFFSAQRRDEATYKLFQIISKHLGFLEAELGRPITEIVSGKAPGIDTVGEAWAISNGLRVAEFPAEWDLGKHAGFLRNAQMAEYADAALVIWDGKSKGSADMLKHMHRLSKPVAIYEMEKL